MSSFFYLLLPRYKRLVLQNRYFNRRRLGIRSMTSLYKKRIAFFSSNICLLCIPMRLTLSARTFASVFCRDSSSYGISNFYLVHSCFFISLFSPAASLFFILFFYLRHLYQALFLIYSQLLFCPIPSLIVSAGYDQFPFMMSRCRDRIAESRRNLTHFHLAFIECVSCHCTFAVQPYVLESFQFRQSLYQSQIHVQNHDT